MSNRRPISIAKTKLAAHPPSMITARPRVDRSASPRTEPVRIEPAPTSSLPTLTVSRPVARPAPVARSLARPAVMNPTPNRRRP